MYTKKDFYKLFWPVLIEQILATTIGVVNTMMVSDVGISAISAVSIVDSLNYVIMNLFIAFASGATVIVAQQIGAGRTSEANETANQSMTACMIAALFSGVVFILFGDNIISLLFAKAEAAVKAEAMTYLIFSAISYPFLAIFSMAAGILRAGGNTKSPMRASILSNIVNAAAGALFIYVFNMGVAGAGIALVLSRISSAGLLAAVLFNSDSGIQIKRIRFKLTMKVLKPVVNIGIPTCIDGLVFNGGKLLIQTQVTSLGTVYLAANGVANSIMGFICIPGNAIAIVAVTVVGQAFGTGVYGKELRKIFKSLISVAIILLVCTTLTSLPLMPFLVSLYSPPDSVKDIILPILNVVVLIMPLTWPLAFILPACIRSTGDAVFVTGLSIMSMWFVRVLGAWVSVKYLKWALAGIWFFWCLDWVVRGAAFFVWSRVSKHVNGGMKVTD